jgi:hypothetical protein
VNVIFAISKERVYGLLFFVEDTVTGNLYLDMLTLWLLPQLEEDYNDYIFQQDGCHFASAWLFGTTLMCTFPGDQLVMLKPLISCGADGHQDC